MTAEEAAEPWSQVLADLLTIAQHEDCGCAVCVRLRAMWTSLHVDQAVERERPSTICADCWTMESPTMRRLRTGAVTYAAAVTGRCVLCGMPNGA